MFSQNPISKKNIINISICFIPITYIAGNLLLNINILLLFSFFFWSFRLKIFEFELKTIDKLFLIFFAYILLNGLINNYFNFPFKDEQNVIIYKTLAYLRFLILYFVLRYLIYFNLINFKLLFLSFGLLALFVSLDIIYQFFYRVDLFGFEAPISERRLAGPFGDEWIAGSFIQRFYIFLIFYFLIFHKFRENWKFHFISLSILFFVSLGVIMSGNRMPAGMFFLSLIFLMVFEKSLRKSLIIVLIVFFSIVYIFGKTNDQIKLHYSSFITKSVEVFDYFNKKYNPSSSGQSKITNTYIKEFQTGISTWQENKIFGGGVKSFYYNCAKKSEVEQNLKGCSSHPHNYYVQISAELGLFGLFLAILLFSFIIFKSLKKILFYKEFGEKKMLLPFFILFIVEIFPFKTTGSFFTTTNATYLFILIPFIIGLTELKKVK